jgi:hypothetical protein
MNNTKEKAKELIDKFYPRATSYASDRKNQIENTIQCALICVDEIIEELEYMEIYSRIDFWQEVREEIKKL